MGLGNLGSLEDLSLKFGIRLVQEEGIGDEEGWIWEECGEYWVTGVKTGSKAVVETTTKIPQCFN